MDNKIKLNDLQKKLGKMNKKKKRKKYILFVFLILFVFSIGYFSIEIIRNLSDKKEIIDKEEEIRKIVDVEEIEVEGEVINPPEEKTGLYWEFINYSMIDVDINKLKQTNNDTVGWVFVNNTNIV